METPSTEQALRRALSDFLRLAADARKDPRCVPLEDALDGPLLDRWHTLETDIQTLLGVTRIHGR